MLINTTFINVIYLYIHRLNKFKYLDKVKSIASELSSDINLLNNKQFVKTCLLFYKELQCADDKIVNQILNHDANKTIMNKLYNLSKLNGNSNNSSIYLNIIYSYF